MSKRLNDVTSQSRGFMLTLVSGHPLALHLIRLTSNKDIFVYKCGSRKCFDLRDEFRTGTF